MDGDVALGEGRFYVGRDYDCQMVIDDPLVSRRHAVLVSDGDRVTIEDLGSRNGTLVNGTRIEGAVALEAGDRITIGARQLVLAAGARPRERRETQGGFPSGAYERPAATVRPPSPVVDEVTRSASIFGMLLEACHEALDRGEIADAETSAGNLVVSIRAEFLRGRQPDDHTMNELVSITLALAERAGRVRWIDRLFEVFGAAGRVMDIETIDRVHGVVLRQGFVIDQSLDAYLARLRPRTQSLGPAELHCLARLEELAAG